MFPGLAYPDIVLPAHLVKHFTVMCSEHQCSIMFINSLILIKADHIFNTATAYELTVLKKRLLPILHYVRTDAPCYGQVRDICDRLSAIESFDPGNVIPSTSVVREFIGGSSYFE